MIQFFKQSWLEEFWNSGENRRVPSELWVSIPSGKDRLLWKLDMLNSAKELCDLSSPPSNHLHQLHGNKEGYWAISVSGSWRLIFRFWV